MGSLNNIQKCCFLFLLCNLICQWPSEAAEDERKLYIVYMGALPEGDNSLNNVNQIQEQHLHMLQEVVGDSFSRDTLVKSYKRSFNGFSAYLTKQELEKLAGREDVVSVFPSRTLWPQTTRSWDFTGLTANYVVRNITGGSDIIIGVIDSGITPDHESFNDEGFGPIPAKWKGVCRGGDNFTCNKKLIGARFYTNGFPSPNASAADEVGHGTHTASTAAGNFVQGASFFGIAEGTARGGVPSARIAVYKVCYESGCSESDILEAFDDAAADGVDIITLSVGSTDPVDLKVDSIAMGALHAVQKGILTTHSAGNNGFNPGTVSSVAPWLFTVAASSTDRGIATKVTLGNGKTFFGKSVNSFKINGTGTPLVYGKNISTQCDELAARDCAAGCLDSELVRGKIVVCDDGQGLEEAVRSGALGVVTKLGSTSDVSFTFPIAASLLRETDLESVKSYVSSTRGATAVISSSESIKNTDAPKVASFSSKGPNQIIPDLLKPDITAPGVEILAAFSPTASVSEYPSDKRSAKYAILSGTSMSCPHVAGAAAFVKITHPDWSPSAIKSALITTAWPLDPAKHDGKDFEYGAGHISPVNATNPGLVYETSDADYVNLLCSIGYPSATVARMFQNRSLKCSNLQETKALNKDLNYPSMTFKAAAGESVSARFSRTVTNVGSATSTYTAKIIKPSGIDITVEPATLSFKQLKEKKTFVVTLKGGPVTSHISASLVWSDGAHSVRSPIVVY